MLASKTESLIPFGINLINLLLDQRQKAHAQFGDERVGLLHVVFEAYAAERGLVQENLDAPALVVEDAAARVAQVCRAYRRADEGQRPVYVLLALGLVYLHEAVSVLHLLLRHFEKLTAQKLRALLRLRQYA